MLGKIKGRRRRGMCLILSESCWRDQAWDWLLRWERQPEKSGSRSFSVMPWLCRRSRQARLYFLPCLYGHHKLVLMGLVFRKLKGLVMPFQITWCNPKYVKKNEAHHPSHISAFSRGGKKAVIISDQQFHLWEKPSKVNWEHSSWIRNSAVSMCIFKHKIMPFTLRTSKDSGQSYVGWKRSFLEHVWDSVYKNKIWFICSFISPWWLSR